MFATKLSALRIASFAAMGFAFAALAGCGTEEMEPVAQTAQGLSLPSTLCVTAHSHNNSGTGNSVYVKYASLNGAVGCTLPNGVSTGATACCTASSTTISTSEGIAVGNTGFILGYSNSNNGDGLRYTNISASGNGINFSIGTYTAILLSNPDSVCEGCAVGTFCNSCWIDSDAHGSCTKIAVASSLAFAPGNNFVSCL